MARLKLVFLVILNIYLLLGTAFSSELKSINLALPTNYGVFLTEVHYHQKDLPLALRVERIVKEDLIKVINYFEYVPKDVVHINIDPYTRQTNGNARPFPTNIINLYNFPASGSDHLIALENWLLGLVLHEFVHIVHLDQTRDYLKVGRSIFGTVAKLPAAVVPRWFTEGVATWGESTFIAGGRLNNELLNKELYMNYKRTGACRRIDCLDAPGTYPHGQLAYWAGAHFLFYIESLKAKSIKCLIEENSKALPFFLNNAFLACTGKTAQEHYAQFVESFLARFENIKSESLFLGEKINNAFGVDHFQKGYHLDGDRLYKVEQDRYKEALVSYDLKDQVSLFMSYDFPISEIAGMMEVDSENRYLVVSFNEDQSYQQSNRVWRLINPDTLLVERTLKTAKDASYILPLVGETFLAVSYDENHWRVYKNEELLYTFSSDVSLLLARRFGERLLFKINDSFGSSMLLVSDLNLKNMKVLYQSKNTFDLPLISSKFIVLRQKEEGVKLLEWENALEIKVSELQANLLEKISFLDYKGDHLIALHERLASKEIKESAVDEFISKAQKNTSSKPLADYKAFSEAKSSFESDKAENYPRLDHFIPHYWFLATASSENLASLGAMTSMADPMENTTIGAVVMTYPTEGKVGGDLVFTQKFINVSHLWSGRASFSQGYAKSDFTNQVNLSRDFTLSTFYKWSYKRLSLTPALFFQSSTSEDFISKRSINSFGGSGALSFRALSVDNFWQGVSALLSFSGNFPDNGKSYLVTQLSGETTLGFTPRLAAQIKGAYSKYFKSDFRRGVIYGGGMSQIGYNRFHEFYGIPYGNVYGNEVLSLRWMLDYNIWDIYRGKNLLPFFFKEVHLLLGRQSLYADRLFLDNEILREKMVNGTFFGPRVKMNLFYYVPTNIDIIFSTISHPNGKNINQVELFLMADFF